LELKNGEIERLRAFAILLVLLQHLPKLQGAIHPFLRSGAAGVQLFFVISGYVVARSLLRTLPAFPPAASLLDRMKQARPALAAFMVREGLPRPPGACGNASPRRSRLTGSAWRTTLPRKGSAQRHQALAPLGALHRGDLVRVFDRSGEHLLPRRAKPQAGVDDDALAFRLYLYAGGVASNLPAVNSRGGDGPPMRQQRPASARGIAAPMLSSKMLISRAVQDG
jgi:hypothetical protein